MKCPYCNKSDCCPNKHFFKGLDYIFDLKIPIPKKNELRKKI